MAISNLLLFNYSTAGWEIKITDMLSPEYNLSEIEDQPTPEQLDRIVRIGMGLAKTTGTIKRSPRFSNAYIFLPDWVEQPLGEEDYCATVHHIAGWIGKVGYKAYSLWLREGLSFVEGEATAVIRPDGVSHVNQSDKESGYTNVYSFAWTNRRVVSAARQHHKFKREGRGLSVERIRRHGKWQNVLVAEPSTVTSLDRRRETVTQDQCDELINQLRHLGEISQRAA